MNGWLIIDKPVGPGSTQIVSAVMVVASGAVKIRVNQTFALKDAADAHRALEARQGA